MTMHKLQVDQPHHSAVGLIVKPTAGHMSPTWLDTSTTTPTSSRPMLEKMGFIRKVYVSAVWDDPKWSARGHGYNGFHGKPDLSISNDTDGGLLNMDKFTITTIALGIGCFLTAIAVMLVLLWTLVRRRRGRRSSSVNARSKTDDKTKLVCPSVDMLNQHYAAHRRGNVHFLSREDVPAGTEEAKRALGIMPAILLRRSISTDSESGSIDDHQLCEHRTSTASNHPVFVNQFSDYVSADGGDVSSPESDISLTVPSGAVMPIERIQQVTVKVTLGQNYCKLPLKADEKILSPVVVCHAPSQTALFSRPVVIRIPHYMVANNGDWTVRVVAASETRRRRTSRASGRVIHTWQNVRVRDPKSTRKQTVSNMSYSLDERYVYIHAYSLHVFAVLGKPRHPTSCVRLCAAVYGNCRMIAGRPELSLRLHLCHQNADSQKVVSILESGLDGQCVAGFTPIRGVTCDENWEVTLSSPSNPIWPWVVLDGSITKTLTMAACQQYVVPPCVEFRCVPKVTHEVPPGVEATFSIAQVRRHRSSMVYTDLLVQNFRLDPSILADVENHALHEDEDDDEDVVTSSQTRFLARLISVEQIDALGVALALQENELDVIKGYQNHREQVYLMVSLWQARQETRCATLTNLCTCLESAGLADIALHLAAKYKQPSFLLSSQA